MLFVLRPQILLQASSDAWPVEHCCQGRGSNHQTEVPFPLTELRMHGECLCMPSYSLQCAVGCFVKHEQLPWCHRTRIRDAGCSPGGRQPEVGHVHDQHRILLRIHGQLLAAAGLRVDGLAEEHARLPRQLPPFPMLRAALA